jgi:hypothetical protein
LITSHPHHRREVVESVERNYREALRYSHEAERAAILAAWGGVLRQAGISSPWAAPCPLDSGTNRLYIQRSHR